MSISSPASHSSPTSEPVPVQPLDYSGRVPKPSDPWRQVVNAFAVAAIVWGATTLVMSMEFYSQNGWRSLPRYSGDAANLAFFILHFIADVASAGLILAGAGCARRKTWVPRILLVSSVAAIIVLVAAPLLYDLFVTPGGLTRSWLHDLIQGLAFTAQEAIFTALLVWLMTREPVRRQFGVPTPSSPEGASDGI